MLNQWTEMLKDAFNHLPLRYMAINRGSHFIFGSVDIVREGNSPPVEVAVDVHLDPVTISRSNRHRTGRMYISRKDFCQGQCMVLNNGIED